MRMDDPLWLVVRESARRVLRLQNIVVKLPKRFKLDLEQLCDLVSESIPSRLIFPEAIFDSKEVIIISLKKPEEYLDGELIKIGLNEPDEDTCWIETGRELLLAGYPGCIGCGGPNAEKPWNEKIFRFQRKSGL
jgi:hypothetical protein